MEAAGAQVNISVCIATYGDFEWAQLALKRAYPSAREQANTILVHQHDGSVATSRNAAAQEVGTDWLVMLDADDELDPGFIANIQRAANENLDRMVLYTPAVSYVKHGRRRAPRIWPTIPIERGNWLIIGTVIHRDLFFAVGGFKDFPHGLEDWNFWARCLKAGATVVRVPRAVYVAHWNDNSKHHVLTRDRARYVYWHQKAGHDVFPERYDCTTVEEDDARMLLDRGKPVTTLRLLEAGQRRIVEGHVR